MLIRLFAVLLFASSPAMAEFQTREIGDKSYAIIEDKSSFIDEILVRSRSFLTFSRIVDGRVAAVASCIEFAMGSGIRFAAELGTPR